MAIDNNKANQAIDLGRLNTYDILMKDFIADELSNVARIGDVRVDDDGNAIFEGNISEIDDDRVSLDTTWSSEKINELIANGNNSGPSYGPEHGGSSIDDENISNDTTWSSNKIGEAINEAIADAIDDDKITSETTWSSQKINDVISNIEVAENLDPELEEQDAIIDAIRGVLDRKIINNTVSGTPIINITIPAGRMKGDIDGDGKITATDAHLISQHVLRYDYITDETALICADIIGDGEIKTNDRSRVAQIVLNKRGAGIGGDITGTWTVNPNYETEIVQFYTDIPADVITSNNSAIIYIPGSFEKDFFRAECMDGFIRLYVKFCPITEIKAIATYFDGDGSCIVLSEGTTFTESIKNSNITIPSGRMKGDVDGDGKITRNDIELIKRHLLTEDDENYLAIVDETALSCAEINNTGTITNGDYLLISKVLLDKSNSTYKPVGSLGGDITGNWTINPNYETEDMQFYTDIPVDGITSMHSANIMVRGSFEKDFFRANCYFGYIRLYAKSCPINELKATIQYFYGDGNCIVLCESTTFTESTGMKLVTIPAGRMRGDIDGDGKITEVDHELLNNHVLHNELITDETALLCADVNKDSNINNGDNGRLNAMIININDQVYPNAGLGGDILGNWTVNPNYETEDMQFYTDIPVDGITSMHSATIMIPESFEKDFFRAECMNNTIRLYAKLCPINELKATIQYFYGDGSCIIMYDSTDTDIDISNKQDIITGNVGDFVVIGEDGKVTTIKIDNSEEVKF